MTAEVAASDDDDDEGGGGEAGAAGSTLDTDMDLGQDGDGLAVRVNAIDAYWLQRQIAEAYAKGDEPLDPAAAQARALQSGVLVSGVQSSRYSQNHRHRSRQAAAC
jgi:N-terminal helicase PWI domain